MKRFPCIALVLCATVALAANQAFTIAPGDTITITAPASSGGGGGGSGGSGGGSGGGSTGGDITCSGFSATRVIDLNWQSPQRMYTSEYGGFGLNDAVVVRFTTGSASTTGNLPRISSAEYSSSPSERIARLSATPCDFGTQPAYGANIQGNSVTAIFAIGTGSGLGYYPVLQTNTTYYLNIKNGANSSCAGSGVCDMFVDLIKVGGL